MECTFLSVLRLPRTMSSPVRPWEVWSETGPGAVWPFAWGLRERRNKVSRCVCVVAVCMCRRRRRRVMDDDDREEVGG